MRTRGNKKTRRAIKRALLTISVVVAILAAGAGFISATNCMEIDKVFWIDIAIFFLASEYVFLFMYANGTFIDEVWKEAYYMEFDDDYTE